ncbi:hypothetical protein OEV98_05590 [Caldibacillus lycopersici]|uniref:Uncharacterized protein n=1 Tax=Perspicuibacillus lycopersici TaxID=1325689 RepID=A0AAE3IRS6_9BACI|nr:hypothetical protein [Perspicuibacillus lycopersici]MCU9613022.1 hypothetical protein [Perspicuibacillus lycopersici]
MKLVKGLKKVFAILLVFLMVSGNVAFAEEAGISNSEVTSPIEVKVIDISEKESLKDLTITPTVEDNGVSLNSYRGSKPAMLPLGYGSPSGYKLSTSQANTVARQAGYSGGAEAFKKDMVKGQRDTTISHYNMFQSTESGAKRGNIYLHHTSTNVYYNTFYNANNGYTPIPI